MTGSFYGWGSDITGYGRSLLFELRSLILKHRLSRGVKCEDLDDCWQTKDIWDGLMTELFNGGEIYITGNDYLLLFEWLMLRLKHRLSQGVVCCLPWLFPVPLLWRLQIPLWRGMMNAIMILWWCCVPIFFRWPSKGESQLFGATTAVMFEFHSREKNWLQDFFLGIILIRI